MTQKQLQGALGHVAVLSTVLDLAPCAGYEVQTLRVATRVLEVAADPVGTAAALERAATELGIGFLNAGATSSLAHLADGTIGRLVRSSQFTSCSFAWQQASCGVGPGLQQSTCGPAQGGGQGLGCGTE